MAKVTLREGRLVKTDAVFAAWTSGDLQQMLKAVTLKTNPINRHYLLLGLVEQTYRQRTAPHMAKAFETFAELHLREFPQLWDRLLKDADGLRPAVPTFEKLAAYMARQGNFMRAIEVCEMALRYQVPDNSIGGYAERIARLKKQAAKQVAATR